MKQDTNLYLLPSKNNIEESYNIIFKNDISLYTCEKTKCTSIEKIQRIDLNKKHSRLIPLPSKKPYLKLGISNTQEFCFIGEKGIYFFSLAKLLTNKNVKVVLDEQKKILYICFNKQIDDKTFENISKNRQKQLYKFINIVIIGSCKKVYIKGKGKKFTSIQQKFFNISLQDKKKLFWILFWKEELKNIFKNIENQGFLLDLNSNDKKTFKSIISENFTIIVEVINKTEILVHGTNIKYIGDYIHKIKKNYPINPYTGEGIHINTDTITPTKSGKKI